jgi:hypothetical protein
MTLKIASTSDTRAEMEKALDRRSSRNHIPLPMEAELQRRSPSHPKDDLCVVTTLERAEPGPDGGTEHSEASTEVYRNGELQNPRVNQELADILANIDPHAMVQRNRAADEHLSDFEQVIGQDIPLPDSVMNVTFTHPKGAMLAYFLARHPELCAQLCEMDPLKARTIAEQRANALTPDDVAQWMTPPAFRAWRGK